MQVPRFGTEGVYTASVIGCTYYVIVALIWSIIWYVALDPIKWIMAWILNEDGFRNIKVCKRAHRCQGPLLAWWLAAAPAPCALPLRRLLCRRRTMPGRTSGPA